MLNSQPHRDTDTAALEDKGTHANKANTHICMDSGRNTYYSDISTLKVSGRSRDMDTGAWNIRMEHTEMAIGYIWIQETVVFIKTFILIASLFKSKCSHEVVNHGVFSQVVFNVQQMQVE